MTAGTNVRANSPPGSIALRTLKKNRQFRACYRDGRKVVCEHAVVFYRRNPDGDGLRVGVVASRRVGGAVRRNRARRLLRIANREIIDRWKYTDLWVVFVARASLPALRSRDATRDIEQALVTAGLLAEKFE